MLFGESYSVLCESRGQDGRAVKEESPAAGVSSGLAGCTGAEGKGPWVYLGNGYMG